VSWHGCLQLHYSRDGERTIAHDRHEGPLRVLQRLYPEGPGICHHVLVHPPGGLAGGDVLDVDVRLDAGTHALITTPGATRFYRSEKAAAIQRVKVHAAAGARFEWLPLETIAYTDCIAENHLHLDLVPGAQALGWDILALGLPAANKAFDHGQFLQHLELSGHWLERGRIHADDHGLLDSPLGFAGHRVMATLWWASGDDASEAQREGLVEAARELLGPAPLSRTAGATSPNPRVVVVRALADRVEPAMALLVAVRAAWRRLAWNLQSNPPRIWRT
jgi:urease accessory protein